jgi:pimeloyl-ACP methyl ester carboxylesterase/predicted glycosyltransferase
MRGRQPDLSGTVAVDGQTIAYESFGDGEPVVLLMPTWCVVHSRVWKMQVPYLSRHFRVITWDGPGNGLSSRPTEAEYYTPEAHVRYAIGVLDHLGVDRVAAFASSGGTHRTLRLAADHPDRVDAVIFVGPLNHLIERPPNDVSAAFASGDLETFLPVFMAAAFAEPHSSKAIEDGIAWGRGTTMQILATSRAADMPSDLEAYRELCTRVTQPVLVVQGTEDRLTPEEHGRSLAETIGDNARLVVIDGGGHRTDLRDPVRFSVLARDFVRSVNGVASVPPRWARSMSRPRRRVLYLSSPIGLGHARRDVAIARELRASRPDVDIDWLAQDPVTRVLHAEEERVHPASALLVNESAHITSESSEQDLHCFQAWRRMDEILTANFMVLHDVLEAEPYDLVIGDEAWEADHFLHENPELKRAPFAWLTDFVGWLPLPEGGDAEERLTSDYNLEMIEHVERFPYVRDVAIFIGDADDIVPDRFGPGLPSIRDWTRDHFDFAGFVTGFDPITDDDRERIRADLGFRPDEKVCVVSVGGSGIGGALLRRVIDAFPVVRQKIPEFRMVVVVGPRIDSAALGVPAAEGLEIHGYVPDLWRQLAASDVAVVQGGLTTTMELTANRRPFLYFPLHGHFEQRFHVPYRLNRYRAGRQMDYAGSDADDIAAAIVEELDRDADYPPVAGDGAAQAAAMLTELLS